MGSHHLSGPEPAFVSTVPVVTAGHPSWYPLPGPLEAWLGLVCPPSLHPLQPLEEKHGVNEGQREGRETLLPPRPFLWLRWVFVACSLLSCATWAPESSGSVVAECGLSCPAECGVLVPQSGVGLTSPALESRFLTTGPPEKCPKDTHLKYTVQWILKYIYTSVITTWVKIKHCCHLEAFLYPF